MDKRSTNRYLRQIYQHIDNGQIMAAKAVLLTIIQAIDKSIEQEKNEIFEWLQGGTEREDVK